MQRALEEPNVSTFSQHGDRSSIHRDTTLHEWFVKIRSYPCHQLALRFRHAISSASAPSERSGSSNWFLPRAVFPFARGMRGRSGLIEQKSAKFVFFSCPYPPWPGS